MSCKIKQKSKLYKKYFLDDVIVFLGLWVRYKVPRHLSSCGLLRSQRSIKFSGLRSRVGDLSGLHAADWLDCLHSVLLLVSFIKTLRLKSPASDFFFSFICFACSEVAIIKHLFGLEMQTSPLQSLRSRHRNQHHQSAERQTHLLTDAWKNIFTTVLLVVPAVLAGRMQHLLGLMKSWRFYMGCLHKITPNEKRVGELLMWTPAVQETKLEKNNL